LPSVPGVDVQTEDTTGGAAHPDPKYMIANFTLTDGSGHEFGPHGNCTRKGYGEASSRLGRILGELANHDRFALTGEPARLGETFIVLTGDHGMENQDPAGKDFANGVFFAELRDADIEFIWQDRNVYLLTMNAELLEADANGFLPPDATTLTFRITDDDVDETGARRPVSGASVTVQSGSETLSGTTNAAGEVTFTFAEPVTSVSLRADRDADPAMGERTVGSSSPNPLEHGIVVKSDYNELDATFTTPPFGVCAGAPVTGCRVPTRPGAARLTIKNKPGSVRDTLSWKWSKGEATSKADFGSPLVDTDYQLCVYDSMQGLVNAAAPADGTCGTRPCWTEKSAGYRFFDRAASGGLRSVDLKAGAAGRARVRAVARGTPVASVDPPLEQLPVTVQLVSSEGECWAATYSALSRNDAGLVKGRSD
jgi:hypothetical protein